MNNRGSISVEALIGVTVFVLLMVFLGQMLMVFSAEDIVSQKVFDGVYQLENHGYLYEKIGLLHQSPRIKGFDNSKILDLLNSSMKAIDYKTKEAYLKFILSNSLDDNLSLSKFDLNQDRIMCQIVYEKQYLFGLKHEFIITVEKQLWLFGDDKSLYPHETLKDLLSRQYSKEKNTVVYHTKTGSKYHIEGCFYLRRSTTDKDKIKSISLYQAQYFYRFTPCKKCF